MCYVISVRHPCSQHHRHNDDDQIAVVNYNNNDDDNDNYYAIWDWRCSSGQLPQQLPRYVYS